MRWHHEVQQYPDGEIRHWIMFCAARDITSGEELTVNLRGSSSTGSVDDRAEHAETCRRDCLASSLRCLRDSGLLAKALRQILDSGKLPAGTKLPPRKVYCSSGEDRHWVDVTDDCIDGWGE